MSNLPPEGLARYVVIALLSSFAPGTTFHAQAADGLLRHGLDTQITQLLREDSHRLTRQYFRFHQHYGTSQQIDTLFRIGFSQGVGVVTVGPDMEYSTACSLMPLTEHAREHLSQEDFTYFHELGKRLRPRHN